MDWFNIIKKGLSETTVDMIQSVLTSEPQSAKRIIEIMYEYSDERRKVYEVDGSMVSGAVNTWIPKGTKRIPTQGELRQWLRKQPEIKSARFDKWTNEKTTNSMPHRSELRHWRE